MGTNDPLQASALPLAVVVDNEPDPTPQERAQSRRALERALRDPDRYGRAVHLAFVKQRRGHVPQVARPRPRTRGAGRPVARRAGASSATSGNDPGDNGGEPPRRLQVVVVAGDPAPGDTAVRRTFERIANEQQPSSRWTVR